MEQYINPEEQDDLKGMLYSYLKDKAQRRAGITSKADYEGAEDAFAKQMKLRDTGALLGGLSEAASMAGQLQGKRAESDIIPKVNQDLYSTTQGAYENFRTLRDQEERSNMNDLNVARYLTDIDRQKFEQDKYEDLEPRRKLELQLLQKRAQQEPGIKRRFQGGIAGPGGEPVVLDESGNPMTLPGYTFRDKFGVGQAGQAGQAGQTKPVLPKGFEPSKPKAQQEISDGQKVVDREWAKDYNEWTSGGSDMALTEIAKLRAVADDLKQKRVTTGGLTGAFPDRMTSSAVLKARADVESSINQSLRQIMGAQFTEKEGARVIKATWNEADSSENNLRRINRLADDLEAQARAKTEKARYFEENGTLQGWRSAGGRAFGSGESGAGKKIVKKQYSQSRNQTKIIYNDGSSEVVDGRQ